MWPLGLESESESVSESVSVNVNDPLIVVHYHPTKLRKGNVFTPVCHSVQGGLCSGGRGVSVQGGLCPAVSLSGASLSRGVCPGMSLSRQSPCLGGVSVRGVSGQGEGLCPGGGSLSRGRVSVQGKGLCQRGLCQGDPLYSNKRVVCILRECIIYNEYRFKMCNFSCTCTCLLIASSYNQPTKLREGNVFSCFCHSVHVGRGSGYSSVQGPAPLLELFKTCSTWTTLYRDTPPPHPRPQLASPDRFKLDHYEACTVGQRAVGILLEIFLALRMNLDNVSYL